MLSNQELPDSFVLFAVSLISLKAKRGVYHELQNSACGIGGLASRGLRCPDRLLSVRHGRASPRRLRHDREGYRILLMLRTLPASSDHRHPDGTVLAEKQ